MALYIARQPILDKASETIGYELLFREGTANIFPDVDGDHASSSVIDTAFFQIGLPKLTSGRKAFINFTPELITGDYWRLLPHDQVVIELLETVEPTEEIIDACRRIKQNGYKIALDDFVYREELEPLIKLADFVKLELNNGQTRGLVGQIRNVNPDIHFIAEKVENPLMFQQARKEGFSLFQGYHFSKPEMVVSKEPLESQAARIQ
jgi:c-di-GMP-related signal transduction protein